jgi:hypothetical protein
MLRPSLSIWITKYENLSAHPLRLDDVLRVRGLGADAAT